MDCCRVFLPRGSSFNRSGYRLLEDDDGGDSVKVVVGKERQVFLVSPLLLDTDPFRILMKVMGNNEVFATREDVIIADVDSILFEHLIWLANNHQCPALLRRHLKEIIDFYSQDF